MRSKILKNILSHGYGQIATLVGQIVLVPLFLASWGVSGYADWVLLTSFMAFLALTDLGIGNVVGNRLSMSVSASRTLSDQVKELINAAFVFQLFITIVILILAGLTAVIIPPSKVGIQTLSRLNFSISIVILAGVSCSTLALGPLAACYRACDQYARGVFMQNSGRIVDVCSIAIAVTAGVSVVGVCLVSLAARIGWFICVLFDLNKRIHGLSFRIKFGAVGALKEMVMPGLGFLAFPLGQAFQVQIVTMMTGSLLDSSSVVQLNLLRVLGGLLGQSANVICFSFMPELSRRMGSGDRLGAGKLRTYLLLICLVVTTAESTFFLLLGDKILGYWTHSMVTLSGVLLASFLIERVTYASWLCASSLSGAVNRHASISIVFLILSLAGTGVVAACLPRFGLLVVPLVGILINLVIFAVAWRSGSALVCQSDKDIP